MKKIKFLWGFNIVLMIVVIVEILICLSADSMPAPFRKAKEVAIKGGKNANGDFEWKANIQDNGQSIEYSILYGNHQPGHEVVLLIKKIGESFLAIGHCSGCNNFKVISHRNHWIEIERKIAIEEGFKFFREIVEQKLISKGRGVDRGNQKFTPCNSLFGS